MPEEQLHFNIDERNAIMLFQGRARQENYQAAVRLRKLANSEQMVDDCNNYLLLNQIFVPPDVDQLCFDLLGLLRKALIAYRIGLQASDEPMQYKAYQETFPAADTLIQSIGQVIQKRLHPE